MEPKVIFEDSEILVLDKPSGVIVNRSDTTKGEKTIQDFVEKYLKIANPKLQIPNKPQIQKNNDQNMPVFISSEASFVNRSGIVHRLDKETSGILLVAKNPEAFVSLQAQFKERKVLKTYIALAHGKIEPKKGEINLSVGRLPWNRKRFGVLSGGRESVTKYRVLSIKHLVLGKNTESLSFVELYPKSGRTHQIRVHLQYIHHSIFSDPLYAGRKTSRNDRKLLPRIFLHASKISFFHPKTNKFISLESVLPYELKQFLNTVS